MDNSLPHTIGVLICVKIEFGVQRKQTAFLSLIITQSGDGYGTKQTGDSSLGIFTNVVS